MRAMTLDVDSVKALASIPSREELLAKLLGVMQAPVTGFLPARWLPRQEARRRSRCLNDFLKVLN